jgi:hypothetical protein
VIELVVFDQVAKLQELIELRGDLAHVYALGPIRLDLNRH